MISSAIKPAVTRLINPAASFALRCGLTPNIVTTLGTLGVIASSFLLIPSGHNFAASLVITFFVLTDLFDGAMARLSDKGPSNWGAFLDSTLDRISDAAVLIALAVSLIKTEDHASYLVLISILTGSLIPYIRAKAESFNIECSVGIAERTERLIIVLVAIGLDGLGLPYVLAVGLWLLALTGVVTTIQRIVVVFQGLR